MHYPQFFLSMLYNYPFFHFEHQGSISSFVNFLRQGRQSRLSSEKLFFETVAKFGQWKTCFSTSSLLHRVIMTCSFQNYIHFIQGTLNSYVSKLSLVKSTKSSLLHSSSLLLILMASSASLCHCRFTTNKP